MPSRHVAFTLSLGFCLLGCTPIAPTPAVGPGTAGVGTAGPNASGSMPATENIDFATARALEVGKSYKFIQTAAKATFYLVKVPGGNDGVLTLTTQEANPIWPPFWYVYNADKVAKDDKNAVDPKATPFVYQVPVTGGATYYFKLAAGSGADTETTLDVQFAPVADAHEPNNDFASAKPLPLEKTVDFAIFGGFDTNDRHDKDFFTFNFPGGQTKLRVKITNNSTSRQTRGIEGPQTLYFRIYDADKALAAFAGTPGDSASYNDTVSLGKAGSYYLELSAGQGYNALASHQVTISAE